MKLKAYMYSIPLATCLFVGAIACGIQYVFHLLFENSLSYQATLTVQFATFWAIESCVRYKVQKQNEKQENDQAEPKHEPKHTLSDIATICHESAGGEGGNATPYPKP